MIYSCKIWLSPDIRDPSLNTTQCVILGHKPIFASYTKGHIFSMLLVCDLFVVNAGSIFSWAIVNMNELRGREIKTTALSVMCFSIHFLSVVCTVYFFVAYALAVYYSPFFSVTNYISHNYVDWHRKPLCSNAPLIIFLCKTW